MSGSRLRGATSSSQDPGAKGRLAGRSQRLHSTVVVCILLLVAACSDAGKVATTQSAAASTPSEASAGSRNPPVELTDNEASDTSPPPSVLLPEQLQSLTEPWLGDLDGMLERRAVRTLVISGGPQFFYHHGKPRGIVSELLALLQRDLNASLGRRLDQVEIVPIPVSRDRLIPALISGQADLAATDLTITEARSELVDFSAPFATGIDEIVVFAPGSDAGVSTLDDLSGRAIYVRKTSSYFEHLMSLNADFENRSMTPVQIVAANELLGPDDILEMVNVGLVDATVVDNYKADYWSSIFPDMVVREDLVLRSGGEIAWAFRKNSPELAALVNTFIRENRQGTLIGNVLIKRYLGNVRWVRNATSDSALERLRPLLDSFRSSAAENDLEPMMLFAQAYQESELDHSKKSPAGALGIMQIKPSTAADPNVGINDISAPADNIRAGAKYMRFLMDRYFSDPGMEDVQQWLFALAAYNAGPAKIRRLRRAAAAEGYDPNLWLDNVEVMVAREVGRETVRYVRNVFKYYVAYQLAWDDHVRRRSLGID